MTSRGMHILGVGFALLGFLWLSPPCTSTAYARSHHARLHSRTPVASRTVIIQMFEWNWDSIAAECVKFIGPAGYGYVQVSPPHEHITGPQWWTDYQPVSYNLTSKRGNRGQFQNMILTCHAAGVKVIVDTIWNHMTAKDSGTDHGVAGSPFTHYDYPGIYQYQDFHHCGLEPGDAIVNYTSRAEVQTCELLGLADLATETETVRSRLARYGNDLISLGADGLRLDAAKHIAATDIANILGRLSRKPYITQEVIWGVGEPIQPSEYVGNGDVQEFRYTTTVRDAFTGLGGIAPLQNLDNQGWVASNQTNVFVANHDTERNGSSLNINTASNAYIIATVFSLAHPYGTPTILSSYLYASTDDGAPNNGVGECSATGGTGGWLCQHRFVAISGMVGFRNNVGSTPMTNWVSPQNQRIAFGRGSAGFVAINNADTPWNATLSTSLPSGSYCDVVGGKTIAGICTGFLFTVSGGSFTASIPARGAIAIHTGALGYGSINPSGMVPVTFKETADTTGSIFLLGNLPQFGGNWDPSSAIALSSASYPVWSVTVSLPANSAFQYKFVRKESNGTVVWESGPNRQGVIDGFGPQLLSTTWR